MFGKKKKNSKMTRYQVYLLEVLLKCIESFLPVKALVSKSDYMEKT